MKNSIISGLIAVAIGEACTLLVAFLMKTPAPTMYWAMIAVGFSTFFGSFFSHQGALKKCGKA